MLLPPAADRYPHRCTIWRNTPQQGADKTFSGNSWSIVTSGVPCRFQTGESAKQPTEFILDEQDNMLTLDIVRFAADGSVPRTGDVLKQTTGPDAGEFFMVRGDAKQRTQMANAAAVRCTRTPDAPDGVN